METKTTLEKIVTERIGNCKDIYIIRNIEYNTVKEYYLTDRIPTEKELQYLDILGFNFTEFAAHYEVVTLDAPDGEICTVDSTCDLEEALKWYNEEINGYVYIQFVDHNSLLISVLKCNF